MQSELDLASNVDPAKRKVVPILLRPFDREATWIANRQMLPRDAVAITSAPDPESALAEVAREIRILADQQISVHVATKQPLESGPLSAPNSAKTVATPTPASPRSSEDSPFVYGPPVHPARFYGRRSALEALRSSLGAATAQGMSIEGLRRIGKSSLLHYLAERPLEICPGRHHPCLIMLDLTDARFHSPQGFYRGGQGRGWAVRWR